MNIRLLTGWFLLVVLSLPLAWAADEPTEDEARFITRYYLAQTQEPVYGLFSLGEKSSLRVIFPHSQGGTLTMKLHGRHYQSPVAAPFALMLTFEDVSGYVFHKSEPVVFQPAPENLSPLWFKDLAEIAGLYGNQSVSFKVPPGTSVIHFVGQERQPAASPNQLLGYLSHLHVTVTPSVSP